jgi:hydroxymethylbilane synthase
MPNKNLIIIGSRKSALAVRQAEMVRCAIHAQTPHLSIEIKTFQTSGDAYLAGNLSEIGNKGLFTKEIEQALLDGVIDIAVHSMKDVATILPDGLIIPAMLPRDDVRDTLLSPHATSISDLPQNAVLGTSSLRRAVQIKHLRPDINVVNYRGNVQRRLAKLEEGAVDATLLAQAGLDRLAISHPFAKPISVEEMLPAVAQGAIGMQCRSADFRIIELLEDINHDATNSCVTVERYLLRLLDGSCRTPIAAYATLNDGMINLRAMIAAHDASWVKQHQISAPESEGTQLAEEVAAKLST